MRGQTARKLNGYRPTHKNKWLFTQHGILTIQELALLEFYADIIDFDRKHHKFGLFEADFNEMALIFGCKSPNTIRNWHNKLLKIGFIKKTEQKGVFQLSCYLRYINPGRWEGKASDYAKEEKDQPIGVILQSFGINLQPGEEKLQPVVKNNSNLASESGSIAIVSSKDESKDNHQEKVKVLIKQHVRNDEEYERIYRESDFQGLTPEDMRWVDENITEVVDVPKANESEIVSVYFNGDYEAYKRNLITR